MAVHTPQPATLRTDAYPVHQRSWMGRAAVWCAAHDHTLILQPAARQHQEEMLSPARPTQLCSGGTLTGLHERSWMGRAPPIKALYTPQHQARATLQPPRPPNGSQVPAGMMTRASSPGACIAPRPPRGNAHTAAHARCQTNPSDDGRSSSLQTSAQLVGTGARATRAHGIRTGWCFILQPAGRVHQHRKPMAPHTDPHSKAALRVM